MRWEKLPQLKFFRTLRFRLASTFLALLGIVLAVVGIVGTKMLESVVETTNEQVLYEELSALRGYLHFDQGLPYWFEDPSEPEEEAAVGRLKSVFVITDEEGKAWRGSLNNASYTERLPSGTYFYVLDLGHSSGLRKGFIQLSW